MGSDDEFLDLKHAIRTYGRELVHGQYVRKREEALDRGDKDEADHWEERQELLDMWRAGLGAPRAALSRERVTA